MAVRAKAGSLGRIQHKEGPPKKSRQGQGTHSKPKGTRKKTRGQGR